MPCGMRAWVITNLLHDVEDRQFSRSDLLALAAPAVPYMVM